MNGNQGCRFNCMKTLLLIPLVVGVALAAAAGLCRLAGLAPHERDLIAAAIVAVIAAEAAMLPAFLLRRSDEPVVRAQAALGGTVLHLVLTIMLASAIMIARVVEPNAPFAYWLVGAYWMSLGTLVYGLLAVAPNRPVASK